MRRHVVTVICLGLATWLGACATEAPTEDGLEGRQSPSAVQRGPLPDDGIVDCVEGYSLGALAGRAFAFDGVVTEIGPSVSDRGDGADLGLPGVTFEVREWFSGGRRPVVTVDMQSPPTVETGSDPLDAYGVGSRLLVSGEARWGGSPLEAPIAWPCGFSRYHDVQTATAWREVLASRSSSAGPGGIGHVASAEVVDEELHAVG